jgi:hypothetical protein
MASPVPDRSPDDLILMTGEGLGVLSALRTAPAWRRRSWPTNPGDLPIQGAEQVRTGLNSKTARRLGLDLRPTLLGLADEVIE